MRTRQGKTLSAYRRLIGARDMRKQHRTALIVAVCAATTAGGGLLAPASATQRVHTEGDRPDLTDLSAEEIAEKASKQLNSARSLRLKMEARDLRLNLTLDEKANCSGKVEIPGKGSVKLIKRGGTIWLKPSAAFWRAQLGAGQGESAAHKFKGRYVKGTSADAELGGKGLATACDLDAFRTASGAQPGPGPSWKRGKPGEIDGHRSIPVTRAQEDVRVRMHVATEGKPYPVKLERKAGADRDEIALTRFGKPVPKGTPPANRTMTVEQLRSHLKNSQAEEPRTESV
ncbi:hypothetical protein [Streptomyces iconiensis]|uniref:Lipoprotein n=1 Tax=Streptomyces iconiensis TaxID=1384038 RepID=A0ABT7AAG0_9ACTN|nr:hypothetical protein [Streptomyces iconiensis]MDJ1138306.1 hypothetical protein [Streptomyces iconiensis]